MIILIFKFLKKKWTYAFDEETFPLNKLEKIGIAVNSKSGKTTVVNYDVKTKKIKKIFLS